MVAHGVLLDLRWVLAEPNSRNRQSGLPDASSQNAETGAPSGPCRPLSRCRVSLWLAGLLLAACGAQSEQPARLSVGTYWEGAAAQSLSRELFAIAHDLGEVGIDVHAHSVEALYDYLLRTQPEDSVSALDMAVVPSSWLGLLAQREVIVELPAAVTDGLPERLVSHALMSARYGEGTLGFPIGAEVIALVYDPLVFPREPQTLEEILATPLPPGVIPFATDLADPRHLAPFAASLQGSLVAENGLMDWRAGTVTAALTRLAAAWQPAGRWPAFCGEAADSLHVQLYAEGKLASFLAGPWLLPALDNIGRRYAVRPPPQLAGAPHPARSLVSYQCVVVARRSPWVDLALEVGRRLLDEGANRRITDASRSLPVLASSYRDPRGPSTGRLGFLRALEDGQALPASAHDAPGTSAIGAHLRALAARPQPPTPAEIATLLSGLRR